MAWSRRAALTNLFAGMAILMLAVPAITPGHNDHGLLSVLLAVGCLVAVLLQQARTLRDQDAARRSSDDVARTDALTGLGNRRALTEVLVERSARLRAEEPQTLALFDLDGFKSYNDAFGHAAGDALLRRMGDSLRQTLDGVAQVFRMGGDEFCVLVAHTVDRPDVVIRTAAAAMVEEGEGFAISASHGAVTMPQEADTPEEALRVADHRMYASKRQGRASAGRQTSDVLLQALAERDGDLGGHNDKVADLSGPVARQLGLSADAVEETVLAARLHDVGKVAIPDAVLQKPGPLDPEELAFIRRHTLIGERILQAAPALAGVAKIVRSTHERWDGGGYPDALAGEAIPLSARIVFVCDAFDAMSTHRPYQAARTRPEILEELRAHAGTQFDPAVVQALVAVLQRRSETAVTALRAA
jgi:diguanylate cyclase (GGDEF)-like protein